MSDTKNVVFIEPKLFDFKKVEEFKFINIRCPSCNGRGKVPVHADYLGMEPDDLEDCQRCEGTGKLLAYVRIGWFPDKKSL